MADEAVDPKILAAIRQIIREEITPELKSLRTSVDDLVKMQQRIGDLEKAMKDTQDRLEATVKQLLPQITGHLAKLSEGLAQQTLQMDVHRRKWNLIIHGIDGPAGEEEAATRASCTKFARDTLRVADADATRYSACHRLSGTANAGVIVRFCDLAQRDRWLAGAKNLKHVQKRTSISPDLPPVLRPLKNELMLKRSQLTPEEKSKSRVRYIAHWPYVELKVENRQPQRPDTEFSAIATKILGVNPLLVIREGT